ncbi:divergent polysaccharide deacetylase family protein [bacterium]|nr:divergent polysaccharide deacetylase family protein [bacterium]
MKDYYKKNVQFTFSDQYRLQENASFLEIQAYIKYYLASINYPVALISEKSSDNHLYLEYGFPSWVNLKFLNRKFSRDLFLKINYQSTLHNSEIGQDLEISLSQSRDIQVVFSKDHSRAKVALIVDDMGYKGKGYRIYKKIPMSITFAILPFYEQSSILAKESYKLGYELMLHMPMQPAKGRTFFDYDHMIKSGLSREEIESRTKSVLTSVPLISGVNNHQGSLSTSDQEIMDGVMTQIAAHKNLYFIDSLTSSKSVAYKTAKGMSIPTLKRNYAFLDNAKDIDKIKVKLKGLIKNSYKKSVQIAIMHEKKVSAEALLQMIDQFKEAGIEIISPSDVLD